MKLNSKLVIIYEFTDQNTNYLQKNRERVNFIEPV